MSKELTFTVGVSFAKLGAGFDKRGQNFQQDVAGSHYVSGVQTVGVTPEPLPLGADLATPGGGMLKNLDAANSIQIGQMVGGQFYPFLSLAPGQPMPVYFACAAPHAKVVSADEGATALLEFLIAEV